jgi:hypothetical protein
MITKRAVWIENTAGEGITLAAARKLHDALGELIANAGAGRAEREH